MDKNVVLLLDCVMGGRAVVRLFASFGVSNDVVIPPFSAKVSKVIMYRLSGLYRRLSGFTGPFKPVSVSPVYSSGEVALLKFKQNNRMLVLRAGEVYRFSCGMVVDEDFPFDDLLSLENHTLDNVFGASVFLKNIRIEVRRFESLGFNKPMAIRIDFTSPTLLQLPSFKRFRRGRYIFFPIPSLMIGSLIDHWNANCDKNLFIKRPSYLAMYSNYVLMEADYRIRPVTVVYDEKRWVRGFMGWVLYDLRKCRNTKSFKRIMALLDYAQYVGVGKSRGAGFGQVSVKLI